MENQSFEYTYCAEQQKEVERIRKKYLPRQEDKMEQLRRLHAVPGKKAQQASIPVGVVGALIMGIGMSLAMTELGELVGEGSMVLGIVIGLVGMVLIAMAYPIHNRVLKKQREIIAPEILRLSDELLK